MKQEKFHFTTPSNDDFFIKLEYTYIEAYLNHVEQNLYKFGSRTKHMFQLEKHNSLQQLNCNNLIDLKLFYRSLNFCIYEMFNFDIFFVNQKLDKTQRIANLSSELTYYDISAVCLVMNSILNTNIQPDNIHKLVKSYIENKLKENDAKAYKKLRNIFNLEDFNKTTAKDQELKIDKKMNSTHQMITLKTLTKSIQYFCEHLFYEDIGKVLYGYNPKTGIFNILMDDFDNPKKSLCNFKSMKVLFAKSLATHYPVKKAS